MYDSAIAPDRPTRPNVGRSPDTPQYADGQTIEPHVSVPIANAASPAATIAPEPLDEPHVQHVSFHGFFAPPLIDAVPKRYPMPPASSIIAALPMSTAPASCSRLITFASKSNA